MHLAWNMHKIQYRTGGEEMMWIWLACSSAEMKSSLESTTVETDSGFYADTAAANESFDDSDEPGISPTWKKISVDINTAEEEFTALVWEDLYTDSMIWMCQRQIAYGKVEGIESPSEQVEFWFQLSQPTIIESNCSIENGIQDQLQVGLGELLQDISVATEITHWLEQDVSLETEQVWGAYILVNSEQLWTFGVGYQTVDNVKVLRTVYSLPF